MTSNIPVKLLVSLLMISLPHNPIRADDASGEDGYENDIQEHVQVTATRTHQRDIDIAAAVTAINKDTIFESAPDVIAEMLRAEPGTFFQQTTPGQGIPIIRGLKGSQVLHMVDGMRLNNAFFRNAPNQYLGLVDSFATQRMEVVRGSQGSLYGADAMGGVLNILTQEPSYADTDWQHQQSKTGSRSKFQPGPGSFYGSYDSVDNGWVFNARTGAGGKGWGFTGGASYQDHSARTSGSGEKLPSSEFRSKAADLKLLVDISDHSNLMLSAQLMEQPSTPRYDELVAGFGQDEPSSEQYLFEPNRRSFIHARFRLDGQTSWFDQFEAHAARQIITDDRLTQEYDSPVVVSEHNRSTLDGLTLQFNSSLASGAPLIWGAEYYTDAVDSYRSEQLEDLGISTEVRSRFPDGSSMDSAAIYLSAEWITMGNFDLNAGLRYSWFNISLPSDENHSGLTLTPGDLTGDIHAVYEINPGLKLVANFGRGFRPPNIFDLATLGPRPGNRFNVANTELNPETVWSYDLGFKSETDSVELEVFVFYLDYSDKITSVFTGDVTEDGRDVVRSENRNKVEIYGIETGVYWAVNNVLRAYAVVNYTRGEEQGDNEPALPADRIPPVNGKLGLEYFFKADWRFKPYLLFAGNQTRLSPRDVSDPRINPLGTAGWGILNFSLDWQATPSLQLGLRMENVSDKAYREHASGIDAPGRNIGVWVNYSFP